MQRFSSLITSSPLRAVRQSSFMSSSSRVIPTAALLNLGRARLNSNVGAASTALMSVRLMQHKAIEDQTDKMKRPKELASEERWKEKSRQSMTLARNNPPAHAYSGRTISVHGELPNAFKQLDGILRRNKVRSTVRASERHEKKGVKRRRLSSQRWRKRFADEVRKKVQLVMKIRNRGA